MDFYVWLLAGAAAGGFVNGLAGFGTALFALGFWLQILPPIQAVPVAVAMSLASGIAGVVLVNRTIREQPARLARFLVPALFGVPLGMALLTTLQPVALKLTVAVFLVLYGGFFAIRRTLPKFERSTPAGDGIVGFLGGVLGGAASLSGALPTMWCALRPWPKAEQRAVLQPYNLAVLALSGLAYAWSGYYTRDVMWLVAAALPATLISSQLGLRLFKRLDDHQFRWLLILLMLTSGSILLLRELVWR